MTVAIEILRDLDSGVTTVKVPGELTFASAPGVRTALNKSASECPAAVIVELTGLEVAVPGLLALFTSAAQRAAA
jgi:anti-anti-sigma regulatory factor